MNATRLYWCDHCAKQVTVTFHDVTEPSNEPFGETTWEATVEKRCSICADVVADAEIVTNRTSGYIKAHAKIEQEAGLPSGTSVDDILRDGLNALRFTGNARVEEIARVCAMFSTDTHEVVGHISFVGGKPVVALRRELRPAGLLAVLRPGSDAPLSFLAQRRAS